MQITGSFPLQETFSRYESKSLPCKFKEMKLKSFSYIFQWCINTKQLLESSYCIIWSLRKVDNKAPFLAFKCVVAMTISDWVNLLLSTVDSTTYEKNNLTTYGFELQDYFWSWIKVMAFDLTWVLWTHQTSITRLSTLWRSNLFLL